MLFNVKHTREGIRRERSDNMTWKLIPSARWPHQEEDLFSQKSIVLKSRLKVEPMQIFFSLTKLWVCRDNYVVSIDQLTGPHLVCADRERFNMDKIDHRTKISSNEVPVT